MIEAPGSPIFQPATCCVSSMAGIAKRQHVANPVTLISSVVSHTDFGVDTGSSSSPKETPALLYNTCKPPYVFIAWSTAPCTLASSVTLHSTYDALPPAASMAATASEHNGRTVAGKDLRRDAAQAVRRTSDDRYLACKPCHGSAFQTVEKSL